MRDGVITHRETKDLFDAFRSFGLHYCPEDEEMFREHLLAMKAVAYDIPSLEFNQVDGDLIRDLTPDHRYWKYISENSVGRFWSDPLVHNVLNRVFRGDVHLLQFVVCFGVTPEMVFCNLLDQTLQLEPAGSRRPRRVYQENEVEESR